MKKSGNMKKLVLMIFPALICGMIFVSCNTEKLVNNHEIEGTYVGIYTTTNLLRGFSWTSTPTIELKDGKYNFKDAPFEGLFCITDFGDYSVSNNKIIFEVKNSEMQPPMQINYAEGYTSWALGGEYNYRFEGEKLFFSKVIKSSPEEYRVEFELYKQ